MSYSISSESQPLTAASPARSSFDPFQIAIPILLSAT
jgi:hypothetical protein